MNTASSGGSPETEALKKLRATASERLIESGERDRLVQLLRTRLLESGWRDQLAAHAKDIVREQGVDNITVDELIAQVTPKGRQTVPDSVKRELLAKIRTFMAAEMGHEAANLPPKGQNFHRTSD
jgi:enhancer of yellow 2 transcription factor